MNDRERIAKELDLLIPCSMESNCKECDYSHFRYSPIECSRFIFAEWHIEKIKEERKAAQIELLEELIDSDYVFEEDVTCYIKLNVIKNKLQELKK